MIDLNKIIKKNEELDELNKEREFKEELRSLLVAIIENEEYYKTDNDMLIQRIGLKLKKKEYKKPKSSSEIIVNYFENNHKEYVIKFNKKNIELIQNYLDNED